MTRQRDSFCPAPWMTFFLLTNGDVDLCCISRAELGSIHQNNLSDLLKSPKIIEIKTLMKEGKSVPGCEACDNTGHYQSSFIRKFGNKDHPDYQDINGFKLKYLDLRWNNTCNYACVFCGPDYSSLWAQKRQITIKKTSNIRQDLLDLVYANANSLEEVYLSGGEPLMLSENLSILREIYRSNPGCRIMINTNLSQINDNEIFDQIMQFNDVQWVVSGEGYGEAYEYLRWPGKWEIFDSNVKKLISMVKPSHSIAFNPIWTSFNGLSIWDYVDYLLDLNIHPENIVLMPYNMDTWDGPCHLYHMPKEYLLEIQQKMSNEKYQKISSYANNKSYLEKCINDRQPNIPIILDYTKYIDKLYNLEAAKIFPTFYKYLQSS